MKMAIEINDGVISNIMATQECSIYIIDHDIIKERGIREGLREAREARQPDCITYEEGMDETPEFNTLFDESLSEYDN